MRYVTVASVPEIRFAHRYGAEEYRNRLAAHPHEIEVSCLLSGSLSYEKDGARYHAAAGDVFCDFRDTETRVITTVPHEHCTVCFSLLTNEAESGNSGALCLPPLISARVLTPQARTLIEEIICTHTMEARRSPKCAGLFLLLLDELSECSARAERRENLGAQRYIERAKKYIYDHIAEPMRQTEIAAHLGITPEYLCAVFRRSEGESVMTFLNRVRLESVRNVMKKEHVTLNRAAAMYGFSDANYASRLYKKYFGRNITDELNGKETKPR